MQIKLQEYGGLLVLHYIHQEHVQHLKLFCVQNEGGMIDHDRIDQVSKIVVQATSKKKERGLIRSIDKQT